MPNKNTYSLYEFALGGEPTSFLPAGVLCVGQKDTGEDPTVAASVASCSGNVQIFSIYDGEMRLTNASYCYNGKCFMPETYQYADNGNLLHKNSVGDINYNDEAHPNQITDITSVADYDASLASVSAMVKRELEKHLYNQQLSYTPFQRVATISQQDSGNITCQEAKFTYNANYERVKMTITQNGFAVKKKYYFGDYEEVYVQNVDGDGIGMGAMATEICYIRTPEGLQAAYRNDLSSSGSLGGGSGIYYFGRDHAGSITSVIAQNGDIVERYMYDAWGRRLMISDTSLDGEPYYPQANPTFADMRDLLLYEPLFDRGYIGEEHIDLFGLMNLNARLYDPVFGRFLSPDPFVQAPDNLQNFNRYSYGLNNPLKYTDATGLWTLSNNNFGCGLLYLWSLKFRETY